MRVGHADTEGTQYVYQTAVTTHEATLPPCTATRAVRVGTLYRDTIFMLQQPGQMYTRPSAQDGGVINPVGPGSASLIRGTPALYRAMLGRQ
jgi:hypothetical protein